MEPKRAGTCRWAALTLLQAYPMWLEAADRPWTCTRETPHPLDTTDQCVTCAHWEPRSAPERRVLTLEMRH